MQTEALQEIMAMLLTWLALNTGFPTLDEMPQVEFIDQEVLAERVCGKPCSIMAWTPYNPPNFIYLTTGMDPVNDVCDQSILLHEIIHLLQEKDQAFMDLQDKTRRHRREMQALVIQNGFLREHGKRLLYSNGFAAQLKRPPPKQGRAKQVLGLKKGPGPYC